MKLLLVTNSIFSKNWAFYQNYKENMVKNPFDSPIAYW